jgi:hypothetical protein
LPSNTLLDRSSSGSLHTYIARPSHRLFNRLQTFSTEGTCTTSYHIVWSEIPIALLAPSTRMAYDFANVPVSHNPNATSGWTSPEFDDIMGDSSADNAYAHRAEARERDTHWQRTEDEFTTVRSSFHLPSLFSPSLLSSPAIFVFLLQFRISNLNSSLVLLSIITHLPVPEPFPTLHSCYFSLTLPDRQATAKASPPAKSPHFRKASMPVLRGLGCR